MNLQFFLVAALLVVFVNCQQEYLNDFDNQGDDFGQDDVYQVGQDDYQPNDPEYRYARGIRFKRQAGLRGPVAPENIGGFRPLFGIVKYVVKQLGKIKGRKENRRG